MWFIFELDRNWTTLQIVVHTYVTYGWLSILNWEMSHFTPTQGLKCVQVLKWGITEKGSQKQSLSCTRHGVSTTLFNSFE